MKARRWCWTLNNYTESEVSHIEEQSDYSYMVYGLEVGESNTPHLQGYVEYTNPRSMRGVKNTVGERAHVETAKGTSEQAAKYCKKDGNYVEHGEISKGQGHRSDLDVVGKKILEGVTVDKIAEEMPGMYIKYSRGIEKLAMIKKPPKWRDVVVVVYWGETGTGKTRKAMEENDVYKLNTSTNNKLWFDGYNGETILVLDDFYGWIKYGELLTILDGYPYRCEVKGGFAWARWEIVIITSNERPENWYKGVNITPLLRRVKSVQYFGTEVAGNTFPPPVRFEEE